MRSAIPEQSARPLRVAIIGAGLMGYWPGRAARHLGSQVVAVVDPDANRARALARACRAAATATDASELLHGGGLDAVHICSPAWTHGALAAQALEAGIHALVEKPMAKSADETRRLIGIAQRKSVILCPVHQVAFQTGTEDAAQALAGLGDPCAIDFEFYRTVELDAANRSWTISSATSCRARFRYCAGCGRRLPGSRTAGS